MTTLLKLGPADRGRPLTREEFRTADCQPGYRYELIDGRLYVSPRPNLPHDRLVRWLDRHLDDYARRRPDVINYVSSRSGVPVEERAEATEPEPDVAAFHDFPLDAPIESLQWEDVNALVVAEVISAGDPAKDLVRNVELYLEVPSIRDYWITYPRESAYRPTLLVYRRRGARWQRPITVPFGGVYTTRLLPGFSLIVDPRRHGAFEGCIMSDLSRYDPTGRFTGLSDLYAKYRPSYPDEAVDFIIRRCGLDATTTLVDVGCGTGISSRLFAARGVPVIGVDPNDEMRSRAEASGGRKPPDLASGGSRPRLAGMLVYRSGRAEATGLPDGSAAAVLCAQAFHWFDVEPTFREFHRILRPGGWVALMWNERDDADPCTAAYTAVVRTAPDNAALEGSRGQAGEPLLTSGLFADASRTVFRNQQELDEEGVLGRTFSASWAPREPAAAEAFAEALRRYFAAWRKNGKVVLRYETTVYLARRR